MPRIIQVNNGWKKYRVNTKLKVNPKNLPARFVCKECLSIRYHHIARDPLYFTIPKCCCIPMLLAGEVKFMKGVGYVDPVDNLIKKDYTVYDRDIKKDTR